MSKEEKMVHILPYKSAYKVKSKYTSEVLAHMTHGTYETVIHLPLSNSLVVLNHKITFETLDDVKMSEADGVFDHTLVIKYYVVTLYRNLHIPKMTLKMTNNRSLVITLNTEAPSGQTVKLFKIQLIPENHCQLANFSNSQECFAEIRNQRHLYIDRFKLFHISHSGPALFQFLHQFCRHISRCH